MSFNNFYLTIDALTSTMLTIYSDKYTHGTPIFCEQTLVVFNSSTQI